MKSRSNKKNQVGEKVLSAFLAFYFSFVTVYNANSYFKVFGFLIICVLSFFIFLFVIRKLSDYELVNTNKEFKKRELFIYFFIIVVGLGFSLSIFYPALMSPDSYSQWEQAQTNIYSNWHPTVHTLLFFKLPSLIYNGSISCSVFQLVFIGSILLYFTYFLRKRFLNIKQTIFVLLLIVLNPITLKLSMYLWKDIAFSWTMFLGTLFVINIVLTKGVWLDKISNKFLFVLMCLGVMLFRHNGIVSIGLLLLLMMIIYRDKWKTFLFLLLGLFAFRFILYGPIYNSLGIDKTGGKSEMMGVVSSQIAYMYHNNDITDKDDVMLLTELAPKDKWEEKYNPLSFNVLKWDTDFNNWADKNFSKIMKLWLKNGVRHPKDFIIGYINITSPIWNIKDDYEFRDTTINNNYSIVAKSGYKYNQFCDVISHNPLKYILFNFGLSLFVIVFSFLLVIKKAKTNFDKYLPFVLVLSNTLVIMFLITGGEVRFIYSQVICSLPLLIYALSLKNERYNKEFSLVCKKLFVDETENSLIQFIRYVFVGGIAAVVNIGTLYLLTDLLSLYYILSNVIAFTLGLIVNYVLSKKVVFTKEVGISKYKEFIIYTIIGVLGLLFDTLFLWIFTDKMSIFYMLSKILSTILVFIWNFGARKVLYKIIK